MATEDDKINEGALGTLVAVGLAAMVGVSLAVTALVRHETAKRASERDEPASQAFRSLRAEAEAKLAAPAAWADAQKGLVSLPIDRAMGLVIADLKRDPWSASPPPPVDAGVDAEGEEADAGVADDAGLDAEVGTSETSDAGSGSEEGTPSGELGQAAPDRAPAPSAMTAAPPNPPKSATPADGSAAKAAPAPPASVPKPAKPASSAPATAAPKPPGSATAKPPAPTATAPKPAAPAPSM